MKHPCQEPVRLSSDRREPIELLPLCPITVVFVNADVVLTNDAGNARAALLFGVGVGGDVCPSEGGLVGEVLGDERGEDTDGRAEAVRPAT
jgi:hypothetical protein